MAVEELEVQRRNGTIPRGTYDSVLLDIATLRRKSDDAHVLRVIVQTVGLERDLLAWQPLASAEKDDPFDLTEAQHRSLERFARRLGITDPLIPPTVVVDRLVDMRTAGQVVQAKVEHNRAGQKITLSVPEPITTDGEITAAQTAAATAAHEAHRKVLDGLTGVRIALTLAAQGCYELHQTAGWRALGFETLIAYLASPEITMSRPEFYRLSAIWDRYVLNGGLDPLRLQGAEESKLEVPLRALGEGLVTAEEAVEDATVLPRNAMRVKYKALVNGTDPDAEDEPVSRRRDTAEASGVPVPVARSLAAILQRVLDEVGRPEQKRMSRDLREAVLQVLALAREHALDVEEPT